MPIASINNFKTFQLVDDSAKIYDSLSVLVNPQNEQEILLKSKFSENRKFTFTIPDSAIQFFNGEFLSGRKVEFFTNKIKDNGNILLKTKIKNPNEYYILKLLNSSKEVIKEFYTNGAAVIDFQIENVPQGKYTIQAVKDVNANAKWDTGDFSKRQQPETIIPFKEEYELKGGWDLEIKINL